MVHVCDMLVCADEWFRWGWLWASTCTKCLPLWQQLQQRSKLRTRHCDFCAVKGDTPHTSKAPVGMAQQMQSEADRLEKIRQRETLALDKQFDKHSVKTPHVATKAVEQKSPNDLTGQHKTKKRKKSTTDSPYFTAKGTADSKKP